MEPIVRLPTDKNLVLEPMPIVFFDKNGSPCYQGKDSSGHIWYAICYCEACEEAHYEDMMDVDELKRYKKKNRERS